MPVQSAKLAVLMVVISEEIALMVTFESYGIRVYSVGWPNSSELTKVH